jgi:hypothetical protein
MFVPARKLTGIATRVLLTYGSRIDDFEVTSGIASVPWLVLLNVTIAISEEPWSQLHTLWFQSQHRPLLRSGVKLAIYVIFCDSRTGMAVHSPPPPHICGYDSSGYKFQRKKQNRTVTYTFSRFEVAVQPWTKHTQWVMCTLHTRFIVTGSKPYF